MGPAIRAGKHDLIMRYISLTYLTKSMAMDCLCAFLKLIAVNDTFVIKHYCCIDISLARGNTGDKTDCATENGESIDNRESIRNEESTGDKAGLKRACYSGFRDQKRSS